MMEHSAADLRDGVWTMTTTELDRELQRAWQDGYNAGLQFGYEDGYNARAGELESTDGD